MKKIILIPASFLFLFFLFSCGKGDPAKISSPSWKVDNTGKYPVTMTAVVQLPQSLFKNRRVTDKLAVFINNECRGVGQRVQLDTSAAFFVLIHGKSSEANKIQFKYYSAHTSYLYQTKPFLDFVMDGNYGTADQPKVLELRVIK
jgi:hypothetical protein